MAVFKELRGARLMEDPEKRVAEDLKRSEEKVTKIKKGRSTSVSEEKYVRNTRIVSIVVALVIMTVTAYAIYRGVMLFVPPSK